VKPKLFGTPLLFTTSLFIDYNIKNVRLQHFYFLFVQLAILNNIIYSNRRFKMIKFLKSLFAPAVVVKTPTVEVKPAPVVEVKVETKPAEVVPFPVPKKTAVKKATTQKPKADVAKKPAKPRAKKTAK